jgi:hypothetical protein
LWASNFDGDVAIQLGIAGAVDFAHAAWAKGGEDFVGAEFVTWLERHVVQLSVLDQEGHRS